MLRRDGKFKNDSRGLLRRDGRFKTHALYCVLRTDSDIYPIGFGSISLKHLSEAGITHQFLAHDSPVLKPCLESSSVKILNISQKTKNIIIF